MFLNLHTLVFIASRPTLKLENKSNSSVIQEKLQSMFHIMTYKIT
jgi:hypothetical protein